MKFFISSAGAHRTFASYLLPNWAVRLAGLVLSVTAAGAALADEPRSVAIEIKAGKVYEIAALWVRPGKQEQLQGYFKRVMPIAMKHGARPLVGFKLLRASIGDFNPTQLGMAEWPSEEAFRAFLNDPEAKAFFPIRDGALEKMSVSHTTSIPPGHYLFNEDKVYEFAFLWVKADKGEQLRRYFEYVKPLAHTKHGCSSICGLQGLTPKFGELDAHMVGITQWDSLQQFDGFLRDPEASSHFAERDDALTRLLVSHFALALPPQK